MLKKLTLALVGVYALTLFLNTPFTARADDTSRSLTVIPPSFELYANPGDSLSDKLRIKNESTENTTYSLRVEDFKALGEEGGVGLVDDEQSNTTYSLAKWVYPEPKTFTVAPGQEKEIPFTINVPKNAEPGGHYGSILVTIGGDAKVQSGAKVSSRVGSLILLRVSGNVKEVASVSSFKSDKTYYEKGPVTLTLRVKDTGNNHIKPKGTIVITNIFGQKVDEIELAGKNVLPGAIRKMDTVWQPKGMLASRYTATLVATYGESSAGKSLSASTSFIVFPKMLIAAIVVGLGIIIFLVTGRKTVKKFIHNLTK